MSGHVCPWWAAYFLINPLRRLGQRPAKILGSYIRQGMTVMDFGCGPGYFSIPMAEMVGDDGKVIAVDLQQRLLDMLKKRAGKAGVAERIDVRLCESNSIGIDEAVDFVLAFAVIHEVPDAAGCLRQLYSCLQPEGKCLIAEPWLHVSRAAFEATVTAAQKIGLRLCDTPHIRMSRTAVFVKA